MVKMFKKYEGYALITGGSSGIGLEFATQLAEQGYNLVLVARDPERLKKEASSLMKKFPVDVITISQELVDPDSTDKIYDFLKQKKIHIGLLVNNAGQAHTSHLHELDRKHLQDMINLNCLSLTDLTYKFLPEMLKQGSGGIILISSIAGMIPLPLDAVYGATKAFSYELGVSLHAEYGSKGIDFLTVCPGYVDTPFIEKAHANVAKVPFLTPYDIVSKSLEALGKNITIKVVNKDMKMHLLLFLINILPQSIIEKLTKQFYKDELHIQL